MGRLVKRSLQEEREHTIKRVSTEQSSKAVPGSTSLQSAVREVANRARGAALRAGRSGHQPPSLLSTASPCPSSGWQLKQ
jgi:hypothetical protein